MMEMKNLLGALVLMATTIGMIQSEILQICTGEDFQISCPRNELIMMTSAEYGRKELGRCITKSDDFMGCASNVMPLLDRWCSGRRECEFEVPNPDLEESNKECLDILKMYLEVEYTCLPVDVSCSSNSANKLSGMSGRISSHLTDTKSCGTSRAPWIISAEMGQTINISMTDFSAQHQSSVFITCKYVYGYILERALGINHTICGGRQREGGIYSSKTNKVEIHVLPRGRRNHEGSFILQYQILGCPELECPAHTWYRREGNEAVIGCEDNDQEWQLTCTGNAWQGSMANCTPKAVPVAAPAPPANEQLQFSSVIIMASVAGGAVVVVVITIVIGIVYIKKYRMRKETKQLQKTYMTMERELQAYYRPTQADMTLLASTQGTVNRLPALMPADLHANQMMSYPDQCSCATLPSRDTGDVNRLLGGSTEPRQSIYSAVK